MGTRVIASRYPVPKMGNAANHYMQYNNSIKTFCIVHIGLLLSQVCFNLLCLLTSSIHQCFYTFG